MEQRDLPVPSAANDGFDVEAELETQKLLLVSLSVKGASDLEPLGADTQHFLTMSNALRVDVSKRPGWTVC